MFGLQLVEQSKGTLKRGTVYVTLGRMQDKGYVESWTEKQPPGRNRACRDVCIARRATAYGCSPRGKRQLARWRVRQSCGTPDDARPHAPSPCRVVCSPDTLERVVEPAIADLQREWIANIGAGYARRSVDSGYRLHRHSEGCHYLRVDHGPGTRRRPACAGAAISWCTSMVILTILLLTIPLVLHDSGRLPNLAFVAGALLFASSRTGPAEAGHYR